MINKTDEELLELIQLKNKMAFKQLYNNYNVGIFNFILRYSNNKPLAQDLLQETFTKIWFNSKTFDGKKGNAKNWIFTIALNTTKNEMVKKRYSYQYESIDEVINDPSQTETIESDPTGLNSDIHVVLKRLSPELREIVLLKHYQQLKFREISKITKTAESTLKSRFQKALSQLKIHLEEK